MQDRENAIRNRAHELWQQNGSLDGQHDEHWFQAEREIEQGFPALEPSAPQMGTEDATPEAPEDPHPGSVSDGTSGEADKSGSVGGPASKSKRDIK